MFSPVAWLRLFLPFLLFPLVASHIDVLRTSSVSYCAPPESIIVSQLDVAWFPKNGSVVFNVSAASVSDDLRVSADIKVNVYGKTSTFQVDICDLEGGALCPLPKYNFVGAAVQPLSSEVVTSIKSFIPPIAYIMPDIEAFAQLTLIDVNTGEVKACLQTTLSNNWSARQRSVSWATAGVVLFVALAALVQTVFTDRTSEIISIAAVRLLDIISLLQTIALSGLLALNIPSLYRSFTLNFAWCLGLFTATANSTFQDSITSMRHHTGGHMPSINSDGATPLVNRKLSPYNEQDIVGNVAVSKAFSTSSLLTVQKPHVLVGGDVATVTPDSSNILQAGIPIFTNSIGISTANAFMSVFLAALIFLAIVFGILLLVFALTRLWRRNRGFAFRDFSLFAWTWVLRIVLIISAPVLVFTFYQWTLKDSWLSVLFSVIIFLAVMVPLSFGTWIAFRHRHTGKILYSSEQGRFRMFRPFSQASEVLREALRDEKALFFVPLLSLTIVKALVLGFGQGSGVAQIAIFFALEILLLVATCIWRPYKHWWQGDTTGMRRTCWKGTWSSTGLSIYLCATRCVCYGLMIAFVESVAVQPIPRTAIGAGIVVVFSLALVVLIFRTFFDLGRTLYSALKDSGYSWGRSRLSQRRIDSQETIQDKSPERSGSVTSRSPPKSLV